MYKNNYIKHLIYVNMIERHTSFQLHQETGWLSKDYIFILSKFTKELSPADKKNSTSFTS